MPVTVIDTIKPKNNGSFPVVEAVDVAVAADLRLPEALEAKADASAVATATAELQGEIDQIVISASAEAVVAPEVAQARVSDDGTTYLTLKERLDAQHLSLDHDIRSVSERLYAIDGQYLYEWEHGGAAVDQDGTLIKASSTTRVRTSNVYKVKAGDVVYLTSYEDFRGIILTSDDGIHFDSTSIALNDNVYTFNSDLYCEFVIISKNGDITDLSCTDLFVCTSKNKFVQLQEKVEQVESNLESEIIATSNEVYKIDSRLYELDGKLDVIFDLGGISVNQDGSLNYLPNPLRIRSRYIYKLNRGTTVSLSSYSDFRLLIFTSDDGITFSNTIIGCDTNAPSYTLESEKYCTYVIVSKNEIPLEDTSAGELFVLYTESLIEQLEAEITEISEGTDNFRNSISDWVKLNIVDPSNLVPRNYCYNLEDGETIRPLSNRVLLTTDKIPVNGSNVYIRSIFDYGSETSFILVYMYSDTEYLGQKNVRFSVIGNNSYTMELLEGTKYIHIYSNSMNCQSNEICISEIHIDEFKEYGDDKYVIKEEALPQSINSVISGKKVVNFGDSIFGLARPPIDVSTFLAERTGATVYNCGFGGCCMAIRAYDTPFNAFTMVAIADAITTGDFSVLDAIDIDEEGMPAYFKTTRALLKTIDFSEVDIITINYGTNDYNQSTILVDGENKKDTHTYAGALRYSIETILATYPNIRVFVITPSYRWWNEGGEFSEDSDTREVSGELLTDYVAKANEVAREYKSTCIDFYYSLGINKANRLTYYVDTVHQNEAGRKILANKLAKELF